ncbi:MAG: SDR family oxidoreductase [Parasphingorhabdus sp.]|uniref:SDR family oxidoreductase n=1 Tax=Alphaproteobacteria TaxID=28211 RepID=UPI00329692A1
MNILLTGATGTIGGELAARLIAAGHAVVALIRQTRTIKANDGRLIAAGDFAGVMPEAGCISKLTGDVTLPGLGLDDVTIALFEREIDLVIHSAAITDFNVSEAVYRNVNIGGVANVLATLRKARLLHISTAYVCGPKDGPIAEAPCAADQKFTNGYERSKAAAEALVLAAERRAVIARPSIVVGAHDDGAFHRFDSFYQLFRLIAEGHITRLPVSDQATLDFVPIDHVAGGLTDIVDNWNRAEGKIIHLTSGAAVPAAALGEAIGLFDHLDPPTILAPEIFAPNELPALERRFFKHVTTYYTSYLQRCPDFGTENLRHVSGRTCPKVDLAALQRMIEYCIKSGFIRDGRAQSKMAQKISG